MANNTTNTTVYSIKFKNFDEIISVKKGVASALTAKDAEKIENLTLVQRLIALGMESKDAISLIVEGIDMMAHVFNKTFDTLSDKEKNNIFEILEEEGEKNEEKFQECLLKQKEEGNEIFQKIA